MSHHPNPIRPLSLYRSQVALCHDLGVLRARSARRRSQRGNGVGTKGVTKHEQQTDPRRYSYTTCYPTCVWPLDKNMTHQLEGLDLRVLGMIMIFLYFSNTVCLYVYMFTYFYIIMHIYHLSYLLFASFGMSELGGPWFQELDSVGPWIGFPTSVWRWASRS